MCCKILVASSSSDLILVLETNFISMQPDLVRRPEFDANATEECWYLITTCLFSLIIRWSSSSQILVFTINTFCRQRNQSALSSKVKSQQRLMFFFNDTTNYVYVNKLNKYKQSWVTECHISHFSGNDLNRPGGPEHLGNTEEANNTADDKRAPPSSLPNNKVPISQPPRRSRDYSWRLAGATECSATCGKGKSHHSSDVFSPRNKSPNSKKVSLKIDWV